MTADHRPVSQRAAAVVSALKGMPAVREVLLVGHSGAGPITPRDAGKRGSRLCSGLRQHLASGGRFPNWPDADLAPLVPNARIRAQLLAELRAPPLDFFTEPIPVAPRRGSAMLQPSAGAEFRLRRVCSPGSEGRLAGAPAGRRQPLPHACRSWRCLTGPLQSRRGPLRRATTLRDSDRFTSSSEPAKSGTTAGTDCDSWRLSAGGITAVHPRRMRPC